MPQRVSSSYIANISASQILPSGATNGQVLTYNGSTSMWVASAASATTGGAVIDNTSISSSDVLYVLKATDANKVLLCNNTAALTAAVPYNTFDIGTEIALIQQTSGIITLSAGNGVTINSNGNKYKTNGINAGIVLIKIQTNTWFVGGDTAL